MQKFLVIRSDIKNHGDGFRWVHSSEQSVPTIRQQHSRVSYGTYVYIADFAVAMPIPYTCTLSRCS